MDIQQKLLEIRSRGDASLPVIPSWNPRYQPRNYQKVGALHLLFNKRFVLGDPTGTGKTVQELLSWAMLQNVRATPLLVVTTKSAVDQWAKEINTFIVDPTVITIQTESLKKRREKYSSWAKHEKAALVMNWARFVKDWEHILELASDRLQKSQVVLDECQKVKNEKSITHQKAVELISKADRVHGLTATLVKNIAHDAFVVIKALVPDLMSTQLFESRYCEFHWGYEPRKGGYRKVKILDGYKNLPAFKKEIEPFYLGRTDEELEGERPKINHIERNFPMNREHEWLYREAELGIFTKTQCDVAAAIAHAQLLASAPELLSVYETEDQILDVTSQLYRENIKHNTKLEVLRELLETDLFGEAIVIYSPFEKVISSYCHNLQDFHPLRITGKETQEQRTQARETFMSGESNLLFISDAGGEGLNLQRARNLIFLSRPWDCGRYMQVVGRIRRFGSEHSSVNIWHLTCQNSIDELVDAVVLEKFGDFEQIVSGRGNLVPDEYVVPLEIARRALHDRRSKHRSDRGDS